MRGIAALAVAILAAAAPAGAEEEKPAFSQFYRAAEGWVGTALVRDSKYTAVPGCLSEDDLDALQYALDDGDEARVQSFADRCVMLRNESWGDILGATPSGGGYLRLRMDYVRDLRELDGIEVFVRVLDLRDMNEQGVQPWDQYHAILGR